MDKFVEFGFKKHNLAYWTPNFRWCLQETKPGKRNSSVELTHYAGEEPVTKLFRDIEEAWNYFIVSYD